MPRFGIIWFGSVNDTEASVFGYSVFTRFVRPLRVGHFPCFEFPLEKGKYCEISPREKGKNREIFVLNSQYIKIDFIMGFFSKF